MKITFVSNYINHHQIPFSNACYGQLGDGYRFIQTEPMEEERVAMGWGREVDGIPYVKNFYEEPQVCRDLIIDSDVAIFGWIRREDLLDVTAVIEERLEEGRPSLRVSERIYREGQWKAVSPRGLVRKYRDHTRFRKKQVGLLCAGAYVASDFHLVRAYPDKMFRFGYFPETRHYTEEELEGRKERDGKIHFLWAGRFMPLKHPEYAVRIGEELQREGCSFHMHMAGSGAMEEELKRQVLEKGLAESFTFYGYMEPVRVREIMERCHVHLFTSNHLEGWGAVVNEAMNSGCAVVGSAEAGAVPYLIRHGVNGMVYRGSYEDFAEKVKELVRDREKIRQLGRAAYRTISDKWNAEYAAGELLRFCRDWKEKGRMIPAAGDGPLSAAPIVAPGVFH